MHCHVTGPEPADINEPNGIRYHNINTLNTHSLADNFVHPFALVDADVAAVSPLTLGSSLPSIAYS